MRKQLQVRPGKSGPRSLPLIVLTTLAAVQLCFSGEPQEEHFNWSRLPQLPEKAGLGGCFAGASGGALLVAGGSNFPDKKIWEGGKKAWHDTVYVLANPNGEWQSVGKLPRPLAYGVSVTTKQKLFCLGGADSERHYDNAFALSWSSRGLETKALPSLPTPLAYAAGAAVGNTIYVTGGTANPGSISASEKFFALNLSDKKPAWQELAPCPGKPRILAVAGALDGAFYFFGGTALESSNGKVARVYLRDAWRYEPIRGWRRLADLPMPCSAGATPALIFGSKLYLVGGDDGSLAGFQPMEKHPGFSTSILAYDAVSDSWSNSLAAPFPNATVQTVFWNDRFVFPGGEPRPGMRTSEVRALKLSAGK